jgi:hypothetical protein
MIALTDHATKIYTLEKHMVGITRLAHRLVSSCPNLKPRGVDQNVTDNPITEATIIIEAHHDILASDGGKEPLTASKVVHCTRHRKHRLETMQITQLTAILNLIRVIMTVLGQLGLRVHFCLRSSVFSICASHYKEFRINVYNFRNSLIFNRN